MAAWHLTALGVALALTADGAAGDSLPTASVCSSSQQVMVDELKVSFSSSWASNACSEEALRCSEACRRVQSNLAMWLPDCQTESTGTNSRAYYQLLLANCTDQAAALTASSGSGEGSGIVEGSGSGVEAAVTTPTPTKRSGASAMGFAGMCGFFAVLAFGHIY